MLITTWNAQGAVFSDPSKQQVLQDIYQRLAWLGDTHIFAIQEAGHNENNHPVFSYNRIRKQYTAYWTEAEDAQNQRCTIGLVLPDGITGKMDILYTAYRRPVKYFTLTRFGLDIMRICCIHAIANHALAKGEIKEVTNRLNGFNIPWLLAGDMNCPPAELGDYSGIRLSTATNTHRSTSGGGSVLDYFFVSTGIEVAALPEVCHYAPSDHDPVTMRIK